MQFAETIFSIISTTSDPIQTNFFYFVELIETYKTKKVCSNWTSGWRDNRKNQFFDPLKKGQFAESYTYDLI